MSVQRGTRRRDGETLDVENIRGADALRPVAAGPGQHRRPRASDRRSGLPRSGEPL